MIGLLIVLAVGLILSLVLVAYVLYDTRQDFFDEMKRHKETTNELVKLKNHYDNLETSIVIAKDKVIELKQELVTEKAKSFNLQTVTSDLEHQLLLTHEDLTSELNSKNNSVFYDQANDVIVAGKDLINIGDL